MAGPRVAPYGSWRSPISAERVAAEADLFRSSQLAIDGDDVYWTERRPAEGGRTAIVRRSADGRLADALPAPFNARTRVHEYGGGDFAVDAGTLSVANFADQRLYRLEAGGAPRPITPEGPDRYADLTVDRGRGRLLCVREEHPEAGEPVNTIVAVGLAADDAGTVLVAGNDFYASPRLSPDGGRLAWLAWDHPNMPWDGTELWVGEFESDGTIGRRELVAGGPAESIFQPEWSPDGVLHLVSDRTGWWNLYRWRDGRLEPLREMEAEFGVPQWQLGMRTYDFASAHEIVCIYRERGIARLGLLDAGTGELRRIETPHTALYNARAAGGHALVVAGSPTEPTSIARVEIANGRHEVLRASGAEAIDGAWVSAPRAIAFPATGGATAHAFYYPPRNPDFVGPPGERSPLIVIGHGGPTSATPMVLDAKIQFWTSRGLGVLDVNYGGSTGYGRAYRERLNGGWGIVDVDDCIAGARYLAERGEVDGARLIIRGGSAGGYTTLCALTFRDVFTAGASYYGISDLEALLRDTHKFESRYDQSLIGPPSAALYRERSPIHYTERLSCPLIIFQGLEDKVVPPNQSEMMYEAVRRKGLPVAYLAFPGEQHGFRKAENVRRSLEAELYFYARVFGFPLAEPIEPVEIANLPGG